jgi:3',5'-cyclic AMP phosphodiesterase CpdA
MLVELLLILAHWLLKDGEWPGEVKSVGGPPPVIAAAGDIACPPGAVPTDDVCHQANTARLLGGVDRVLTLGDNQYETGALREFRQAYDSTWGRYKAITEPVPGNHEYRTPGAQGYHNYFGKRWWYSYDVGTWHLIALDSGSPKYSATGEGSAQNDWLEADLAAEPAKCTLAYWHHPRYSAVSSHAPGRRHNVASPLWADLIKANADVVLNGHYHNYQRWAPMNNTGDVQAGGIRQFVVGTGGKSHSPINTTPDGLRAFSTGTFGVLKLTLHPMSYDWSFVTEDGQVLDTGTANCR